MVLCMFLAILFHLIVIVTSSLNKERPLGEILPVPVQKRHFHLHPIDIKLTYTNKVGYNLFFTNFEEYNPSRFKLSLIMNLRSTEFHKQMLQLSF